MSSSPRQPPDFTLIISNLQLAGVVQAVHGANGDVGALVFGLQENVGAARHFGCVLHHDPVFGAVVVILQSLIRDFNPLNTHILVITNALPISYLVPSRCKRIK